MKTMGMPPQEEPKSKKWIWITVIVLVLLIIAGLITIFVLRDGVKESGAPPLGLEVDLDEFFDETVSEEGVVNLDEVSDEGVSEDTIDVSP